MSQSKAHCPPTTFVSTAIPYVNAAPHLGHALEFVLADAVVATRRREGADVWFTSGTDDNSAKNVSAAALHGTDPQSWVERNAAQFARLLDELRVRPNAFVRTSNNPRHERSVRRLWQQCAARGDIYPATYEGYYCVGCERFFRPSELPSDGKCPEHGARLEAVRERNWFFRLSRFAEELETLIDRDVLRVVPEAAKRETLAFLRSGLEDISISRQAKPGQRWGIPAPKGPEGDFPEQTIWVWFDALTNYLTSLGFDSDHDDYQRYWINASERVHVIGKGICRFHTVFWPALLLSAGLPLPTEILVHGYLTLNAVKISKSGGNAVDAFQLLGRYGSDALRYFLLRHVHPTKDSDFSEARLALVYRGELANQFGNLVSRLTALVGACEPPVVPAPGSLDGAVTASLTRASAQANAAARRFAHHEALAAWFSVLADLNKYFDAKAPWHLAKAARGGDAEAARRLNEVLGSTAYGLFHVCAELSPYLPDTARRAVAALGEHPVDGARTGVDVSVRLFPRV